VINALGAWFVQTQSQPQSELNLDQLAKMPPPPANAGKLVQYEMEVAGSGDAMASPLPAPFDRPLFIRFDVHIHNTGNKAVLVLVGKSAVECAGLFIDAVTTMEDNGESDIGLLRRAISNEISNCARWRPRICISKPASIDLISMLEL
jgi:hypothetical protein